MNNWNMSTLIQDLISHTATTHPEARQEIWASDIGKPMIDRWLEMRGVPYSDPLDGKTLATFFIGKAIENGLKKMLIDCGLAYEPEEKLTIKEKGCLPVVGKPDVVLEVKDWKEPLNLVDQMIKDISIEEEQKDKRASQKKERLKELILSWKKSYPEGLPRTIFEIKSINSRAFSYHQGKEGLASAYPHHQLQLYTYMRAMNLKEGHVIYVAKDTGFMQELILLASPRIDEIWLEDVKAISKYIKSGEQPPLEPLSDKNGRENWKVRYSRYRSFIYFPQGDDRNNYHQETLV